MIEAHGAKVHVIPGSRDHCADVCRARVREEGIYYANHVVNPFFYEGMKAYIYEVYEELGRIPEHVVLPVGNGTLFIGAVKALEHLLESGAIDHFPKIVALQSEYCDPLLKARELGLDAPVSIDVKPTIAEGIAIGKPLRGSELLEMMKKHDITVVAAPEDKILAARAKIARAGLYIEHTTAANFAAWDHYCELYGPSTDVLITLCGAGIKSDHYNEAGPESQYLQIDRAADLQITKKANRHHHWRPTAMLGILITLLVIAGVAYCVLKNYYPPIILLLAGFVMLICAALNGTMPVADAKSTHFFGFDLAEAFTNLMKGRLPGLGLNIMLIAGFSVYMDRIGASKALVKLCVKPLSAIRSPYVLLAVTYVVGQFMALFINSAVGLGLLLMASIYPLLIALGVSRASAAAVIGSTCCLDLGPSSSNAMRAADLLGTDVVTYFVQSQIPVALCVIATVAVGHFFIQRWFDRKAQHAGEAEAAEAPAESTDERLKKAFEGAGPVHYALLPVLPLVLLIVFSPMVYDGIKLSLQTGLIVSIIIAFVVDFITRRSFRESTKNTQAVFEGMGKVFTSTVGLICCAELFALGMNKLGGISTLISMAASMESAGVWVMLLIMLTIMVVATVVTGSGNAAFFAFSPLLPEAAASVGINAAILAVPVQLSAGIARTMCPIAGVIIAVSGIAGLSPFELVRRTAPVMILALIMNVAASAIFL